MIFNKVKTGFKRYFETIKPMTFKEKVSHTFEYYKGIFLGIIIVAIIFGIVLTAFKTATTKIIVSGIGINIKSDLDSVEYLTTDFYEKKKTGGRETCEFSLVDLYAQGTTDAIESTYDQIQSIVAQVSAKKLDYIVTDELGFEFCLGQELFMDLRNFLTEEELNKFKDKIIYGQEEGKEEQVPLAINISDCGFAKKYCQSKETFFCVIINTPRKENTKELFNYLLNFKE